MTPTYIRVGKPKSKTRALGTVRPPTQAADATLGTTIECNAQTNTTSTTFPVPSNIQIGDLAFVAGQFENGLIDTVPAGWTEQYAANTNGDSFMYAKTIEAADLSGLTITFTNADNDVAMLAWFLAANGGTLAVSDIQQATVFLGDNPPAVTVTEPGDYWTFVMFHANKGSFPTDQATDGPTGYSVVGACNEASGVLSPAIYVWSALKSITTSEDPTLINWSSSAGSRIFACQTIAVKKTAGSPSIVGYPVTASDIDSEASTDGQVLTSDGAGNAAWEAVPGGVTNGDAHDHAGGDGAQIDHGGLAGLTDDDHAQYVKADGTRAFTGEQSMGSNKLTNVTDPTAAQDAATKAYVDANAGGGYYEVIVSGSAPPVAVTNEAADDWLYGLVP